jgi:hypothetical protein
LVSREEALELVSGGGALRTSRIPSYPGALPERDPRWRLRERRMPRRDPRSPNRVPMLTRVLPERHVRRVDLLRSSRVSIVRYRRAVPSDPAWSRSTQGGARQQSGAPSPFRAARRATPTSPSNSSTHNRHRHTLLDPSKPDTRTRALVTRGSSDYPLTALRAQT